MQTFKIKATKNEGGKKLLCISGAITSKELNAIKRKMEKMRLTSSETRKMYNAGGFRERYAMEHGNRATVYINGEKCYKFTYSKYEEREEEKQC